MVKLFGYKSNDKFLILESFVKFFLEQKNERFDLKNTFSQPKITHGVHGIDILVLYGDFAIIIENKIHDARDQNEQLIRYIDKIKRKKINEDNIFVIYLSGSGGTPTKNSFPDDLRTGFQNRYIEILYRYDIIRWLELFDKRQINNNKILSALQQYVDHLKGMFKIRDEEKTMNEKLFETIKEQLKLGLDNNENIIKINATIENLDITKEYLNDALRRNNDELKRNWFNNWHNQLLEEYSNYQIIREFNDLNNYPNVGIALKYKEIKFSLLIEMGRNSRYYYGIKCHDPLDPRNAEIEERFFNILVGFRNSHWWYGYQYVELEDAYCSLKLLIDKVMQRIN